MAEETTPTPETQTGEAKAKPPAAKKPKEPTIEEKPFPEFMEQHFTPALKQALAGKGLTDLDLSFKKAQIPVIGLSSSEPCYMVQGSWQQGQRQFNLYFLDEDINGKKAFSCNTNGTKPSLLESFMIDERKVTLNLLVLYTLQRLNGQKWLTRN